MFRMFFRSPFIYVNALDYITQKILNLSKVLGFLGEQNGHIVFEQDRVLNSQSLPEMLHSIESQINVAFEVHR